MRISAEMTEIALICSEEPQIEQLSCISTIGFEVNRSVYSLHYNGYNNLLLITEQTPKVQVDKVVRKQLLTKTSLRPKTLFQLELVYAKSQFLAFPDYRNYHTLRAFPTTPP